MGLLIWLSPSLVAFLSIIVLCLAASPSSSSGLPAFYGFLKWDLDLVPLLVAEEEEGMRRSLMAGAEKAFPHGTDLFPKDFSGGISAFRRFRRFHHQHPPNFPPVVGSREEGEDR